MPRDGLGKLFEKMTELSRKYKTGITGNHYFRHGSL